MDSEFGDFSWLTNMQHKFEALLPDVEDVLSDERLKYVEDQFQNVGSNIQTQIYAISANFTQFCSEFAHDVLSPSSSILSDGEKEDVIVGKGNSSFFHNNEKILFPDQKELDTENKVTDDLISTEILNVDHADENDSCLESSFSDTIEVSGSKNCKDCQDEEKGPVSVHGVAGELLIHDDLLKSRSNLLPIQDDLLKSRSNLLPIQDGLLKSRSNLLPIQDDLLKSRSNLLPIQDDLLKSRSNLLPIQDGLLKSRSNLLSLTDVNASEADSCMDNMRLAKEVTVWEDYFTPDCECSIEMDGEAAGNRIMVNYDDDVNISSELNLVLLEKDETVVVCHGTTKHQPFKEKSGGNKANDVVILTIAKNRDGNLSSDSDWEII